MDKINAALRKALDTGITSAGATNSTGDVLINEFVEQAIEEVIEDQTPLYKYISKRPWKNNVYKYRLKNQLPAAFWADDGQAPDAADHSDYADATVAMKYIYSRVEVTGPEQASVDWMDVMQDNIDDATTSISRELEISTVAGDSTANPKQFDGLLKQITTHNLDNAGVDRQLTLPALNEIIDAPNREPDTLVMENTLYRRLWSLAQASLRYIDDFEVDPGFVLPSYQHKPILKVDQGMASDLTGTIIAFRRDKVRYAVQKPLFGFPLAKTKDSDDYLVGMYITFAVIEEDFYHAKGTHLTA